MNQQPTLHVSRHIHSREPATLRASAGTPTPTERSTPGMQQLEAAFSFAPADGTYPMHGVVLKEKDDSEFGDIRYCDGALVFFCRVGVRSRIDIYHKEEEVLLELAAVCVSVCEEASLLSGLYFWSIVCSAVKRPSSNGRRVVAVDSEAWHHRRWQPSRPPDHLASRISHLASRANH